MKFNYIAVLLLLLAASAVGLAQKKPRDVPEWKAQLLVKKNLLIYGLENQLKDVNFAAPRVLARYKLSSWLWKDGKDETGRAEDLAAVAVDDLFLNKVEIPPPYFESLSHDLFALLDRNAPVISKRLKNKYSVNTPEVAGMFNSLLAQPGGEKIAVDIAIRSLSGGESDPQLVTILDTLNRRRSPEVLRLLEAIVSAEETGAVTFGPGSMILMSGYFSSAPTGVSGRFVKIVLQKARYASQLPVAPFDTFLELLSSNLSVISQAAPEMSPEANVVLAVLTTRVSQASRLERERNDRVNNSADKLSALISEAEDSSDNNVKYEFYIRSAHFAASVGKYKKSVDLMKLATELDASKNLIPEAAGHNEENQFFSEVAGKALKATDDDSARYAIDKIRDPIGKSEGYLNLTGYYIENAKLGAARESLQQSLLFAANVEDPAQRSGMYIRILPIARSLDSTSVFEMNRLIAKSVNALPSLNVEDKPETDNYKNHVIAIMIVNWHLLPALRKLSEVDRNGAADLIGRIDRKEIRVLGDSVLETSLLDEEIKSLKKKGR